MRSLHTAAWLAAWTMIAPPLASAQPPGQIASAAEGETMEVDPIACWWRTDKPSVFVGEPFTLVLTCSALDDPSVSVLVDQTGLDSSVIQLPPFEVLGGSHAADQHTRDRRFFQYEYRLRLINESEFGADVPLPGLAVSYRVRSMMGGEASDSRERGYQLPLMLVRIQSLVPRDANDIRDATAESFADLDTRTFRANAFVMSGGVLFALAGAFVVLAGVQAVRGSRGKAKAADRLLADRRVLGGIDRELADIRRARDAAGWTDELAGRALSALRIAAGYAVDQRASQTAGPAAAAGNGHGALALPSRLIGPRRPVLVSGSATAESLAKAVAANAPGVQAPGRQAVVQSLQDALRRFTAARYGRGGALDETTLDEALESGRDALQRLRREHTIVARALSAITSRQQTEARS
jgi:hypothetical protein